MDYESISQDEVNEYLDELRESGETNMFGAAQYVEREFNVPPKIAKAFWVEWTRTFAERHPSD